MLREDTTRPLLKALSRGRLDLALVHVQTDTQAPGLVVAPLCTEDLVLALASGHPLTGQGRVPLTALRQERWILLKPGSTIREQVLAACAVAGFTPTIAFETSAAGAARALAAAGLGVTALPRSVAAAEPSGLALLDLRLPLRRTLGIAARLEPQRLSATTALLAFIRQAPESLAGPAGASHTTGWNSVDDSRRSGVVAWVEAVPCPGLAPARRPLALRRAAGL